VAHEFLGYFSVEARENHAAWIATPFKSLAPFGDWPSSHNPNAGSNPARTARTSNLRNAAQRHFSVVLAGFLGRGAHNLRRVDSHLFESAVIWRLGGVAS